MFYLMMAGVFALIAFAGFSRTYLRPVLTNRFNGPAILHVHGILFFGWTILLAWQSGLVRRRRVDGARHGEPAARGVTRTRASIR